MKRLEIKEPYVKDFGLKLSYADFYEEDSINDFFRKYLSNKYKNADTYIKPFSSYDWVDHFVVQFVDRDCIVGKHYNAIELPFCREPNDENNFKYVMGDTWYHHGFVTDGRRFFDGTEKELSYKLVDDTIDFLKNYKVKDCDK